MKNYLFRSLAIVSLITCVSGPVFASPPEVVAQAEIERPAPTAGPKLAPESNNDAQIYAAREQSTKSLATFKGGEGAGIYIGGGALSVALLIVLLIVVL